MSLSMHQMPLLQVFGC